MIFLGILISIAAIGFFCWLLFTLAVFALPFFAGLSVGVWAYHTGAGWLGAIVVGVVGGGLTLGVGQILVLTVRPMWAKLAIALIFVAPAAIAGFHATHGIVKHAMPSRRGRSFSPSLARSRSVSRPSCGWRAWRLPTTPAGASLAADHLPLFVGETELAACVPALSSRRWLRGDDIGTG